MKKVLLASTALIVTAGYAAADVTLSGSANFGVNYDESRTTDEVRLTYEVDFGISGSGTTDGGLSFGASVDLDAGIDSDTGDAVGTLVSDPEVFISGAFGTLTVGDVSVATDPFGISDVGFNGIGIDDGADSLLVQGSANVLYQYTFGQFAVDVSFHTINEDYSVIGVYSTSMFDIGVGYAEDDDGDDAITVNGSVNIAGLNIGGVFTDASGGLESYGADVTWSDGGALSVTAAVGDVDGQDVAFGVGASYDLGGGASLGAGIGSANDNVVADFGINLSF